MASYLIVDRSEEYVCLHLFARDAAGKHILPGVVEAVLDEDFRHVFDLNDYQMRRGREEKEGNKRTFEPPNAVPYCRFPSRTPA